MATPTGGQGTKSSVADTPMVDGDEPVPAIFDKCERVYKAMEKTAKKDDEGRLLWTGGLVKLLEEIGIGHPFYTAVTRTMRAMGSIEQVQRGGGRAPSVWQLLEMPTIRAFEELPNQIGATNKGLPIDRELQRQRDTTLRVNALEDKIKQVLTEHQILVDKFAVLEEQVESLLTSQRDSV